jgi:hypothetical protein
MIDLERVVPGLDERRLLPPTRRCVFTAGSLIRGWGNRTSDLDIYIVTRSEWRSDTGQLKPVQLIPDMVAAEAFYVDGRKWDVEYWLDIQVEQALAKMSWAEYEDHPDAGRELSWLEDDFLERLSYAVALENDVWLREKATQLAGSAFGSIRIQRALDLLDLATEDAVGQLDGGDVESAVLAVRLAFGHAVDALLASHGEYGHNEKWRARRMLAIAPPQLSFHDYWAVETMRDFDPTAPRAWVERVLERCQRIAQEVGV